MERGKEEKSERMRESAREEGERETKRRREIGI